jgi:beta-galactosidase
MVNTSLDDMKKRLILFLLLMVSLSLQARSYQPSTHTFTTGDKTFLLDGKPFVVKAAEIHYPRIPRPYWDHRIKMCKALGMNAVCIYIFWNIHEQAEGTQRDRPSVS